MIPPSPKRHKRMEEMEDQMGDPEIDAQEDENITHTAVVSQEPLPGTTNRIKNPILNKQVFFFIPLTTP
jgi:hypothetical protein